MYRHNILYSYAWETMTYKLFWIAILCPIFGIHIHGVVSLWICVAPYYMHIPYINCLIYKYTNGQLSHNTDFSILVFLSLWRFFFRFYIHFKSNAKNLISIVKYLFMVVAKSFILIYVVSYTTIEYLKPCVILMYVIVSYKTIEYLDPCVTLQNNVLN